MTPVSALSELVSTLASFFNPARRHEAYMRSAIQAAEQYMLVNERVGRYEKFSEIKHEQYLNHFKKQFEAFKNK